MKPYVQSFSSLVMATPTEPTNNPFRVDGRVDFVSSFPNSAWRRTIEFRSNKFFWGNLHYIYSCKTEWVLLVRSEQVKVPSSRLSSAVLLHPPLSFPRGSGNGGPTRSTRESMSELQRRLEGSAGEVTATDKKQREGQQQGQASESNLRRQMM